MGRIRQSLENLWNSYWAWYERHYLLNLTIAVLLFVVQLAHLYWLTADVVFPRLGLGNYWIEGELYRNVIILVDYTEIPAIVSVSLVYVNELRERFNVKDFAYLVFVDIQLVHIYWLTDEFVIEMFSGTGGETWLPLWAAWIAILIDYLELPVIAETVGKFFAELRKDPTELVEPGD